MDGTVVSLFGDYKHGGRHKASPRGRPHPERVAHVPTLPRAPWRRDHRRGKSSPRVEPPRRLTCATIPTPSLESQSLPKLSLRGSAARQQRRHGDRSSIRGTMGVSVGVPTTECHATQSLPSLPNSNSVSKATGRGTTRGPQRSLTFDLFRTSRHGRQTAACRQNFSWDLSPRTEVAKTCWDTEKNRLPQRGERNAGTSTRPVHLYMSVEMMDKLLEKRKGLRSDAMLNELIGLPPPKMRVSARRAKKRPRRGGDIQNRETVTDGKSKNAGQHGRDADSRGNASTSEQVTRKARLDAKTTPEKQPQDVGQHKKTETVTQTASANVAGEDDDHDNATEGEFQDEEEDELGGLDDDDGSTVFDGCGDDEEDADEEDAAEEVDNDEVDSDDEGRGTSLAENDNDGERSVQGEEDEDAEDTEDGEAGEDGANDEVEEEEVEDAGSDDDHDDDGEDAEGHDENEDDGDVADDEQEEAEGVCDDEEEEEGEEEDEEEEEEEEDNDEDDRTEGISERGEEMDELENDDDVDTSDADDDDQ